MSRFVARVEEKTISEDDVLKFIQEIGPEVAMQFQSEEGIKKIVEEMVNQELLLLDAKDKKLEDEEEFKKVLNATKDNLLKSYAFGKILQEVKISEEEAKDYFEKNKSEFQKETVNASHILVDTLEEADSVLAELKNGVEFGVLARQKSKCPSKEKGGDLGTFAKGQMVKEFEDAAFNMKEGEISKPVKTQFGYHVIKLNSKKKSDEIDFKDVKKDVESELKRIKQQQAYQNKIAELKNKYDAVIYEN